MSTTNDNITNDSNTATRDNNDKMNTNTLKIKINFQGTARDVDLPSPITLAGLQQAVASTFETEMPARSAANEAAKDSDLCFTYKDPEGDDIVFDKDSELSLALRLCPSSLEITAAAKGTASKKSDPERRLYAVAARNLREYNGVPSMTPEKLTKTLAFLQLNPRRLVRQDLAPKALLVRMAAEGKKTEGETQPQPLGGDKSNSEDLPESVAAGMELMNVEDDEREWSNGFVSVEASPAAAPASATAEVADSDNAAVASDKDGAVAPKKNVLHEAFITAGIRLRPREVRPLLLALDVRPRRLVKLGYVDGKHLGAMLEEEKKAAPRRKAGNVGRGGPGHRQRMTRGCGVLGVKGPGGKPCGQRMMMRRNLHPVAHMLPPPPAFMVDGEEGMFFVPVRRGGGGRRGPPHGPPHGPPPHKRHGRHAHGAEEDEDEADFHRGPLHDPPHGPPQGPPPHTRHGRHARGPKEDDGADFHRCPPFGRPHGPPPHKLHGRHAGGQEENEDGADLHRGPRHGMMRMHQARGGRQPKHEHQQEHGYFYYWG